jgi:hypothetical protein
LRRRIRGYDVVGCFLQSFGHISRHVVGGFAEIRLGHALCGGIGRRQHRILGIFESGLDGLASRALHAATRLAEDSP